MFEIIGAVVALVVTFVAGAAVGVHNVPTVDRAIAAIKAAEVAASATLASITAHKAS